jgi:anti-anti-sigma factor
MQGATYESLGNTLKIHGNLDWPLDLEFDIQTKSFLEEAKKAAYEDIRIDVTKVEFMGSQYLGAMAAVAAVVKSMGATLTVIATGKVGELLHQIGLHRVMKLELV